MFCSIIIPTLNEEKFIGGLLGDLTGQTLSDFEVIHIDGNSEDKTCQVVDSFRSKLKIKTITTDKRNLSYQRNIGATHATGDYLFFVDADTRIDEKDFLSCIRTEAASRHLMYLPKVKVANDDPALQAVFTFFNQAVRTSQMFSLPIPTGGLAIFERHFFEHIGGYEINKNHDKKKLFAEDQEILKRAKKAGVTGKYIDHTSYIFSLRRFEREGWLSVFPKILMSVIEQSVGRQLVQTKYEMGGHLYEESENDQKHESS
ncbi:MAG: glycosyltransferase [Candidatus Roizmanbacteria bacterium]